MRRCSSWAVACLAACATQEPVTPAPTISGRYDVTSAPGCVNSPIDLELELNGDLIDYNAMPSTLIGQGAGVYSASRCDAVECQSMDGGIVMFSSARIERTSTTTIHGTQAGKSVRLPCTEGVCPAGFGSDATSCELDATLREPAPVITSVSPSAISSTSCSKTLTLQGGYFQTGVRVAYITAAPSCAAPTTDRGGEPTCALVVDGVTPTAITAHFASCPAQNEANGGTLPLVITNPAGSDSAGNSLPGLESVAALQLAP